MLNSWNNYPQIKPANIARVSWQDQIIGLMQQSSQSWLAYGNGRSYGDVCLNGNGTSIIMNQLNHFIDSDAEQGVLRCEAGVTFKQILQTFMSRGWMLPVVPGTQYVTVGGAIANDIHGKNHHSAGSLGCHIKKLALLKSDGKVWICSPTENIDLFKATIGGLGLTGIILWSDIQLQKVRSQFLTVETIPFYHLDEFFKLAEESVIDYEYTVAWLDGQMAGKQFGRGLFMRANWRETFVTDERLIHNKKSLKIPCFLPNYAINPYSMKIFNALYFAKGKRQAGCTDVYYEKFFFPLDNVLEWNKVYGRRGFFQHQCVIPKAQAETTISQLLEIIVKSGQGSCLSVLKTFGAKDSPGMLSFPREGATLAMDFPNKGKPTQRLLTSLDEVAIKAGGRIYLAKDARMSSEVFATSYPQWHVFSEYIDPQFSSSFWQRITRKNNERSYPMIAKKILIIGATSAIAQAVMHNFADQGHELFLVARSETRLQTLVNDCKVRYNKTFGSYCLDVNDFAKHEACIQAAVAALQGLDIALIAHGTLSDQSACEQSVEMSMQEFSTNALSYISLLGHLANYFEQQKHGTIAAISSCAGDRGRKSNYTYGAAKSAISAYLQGLRNRLHASNVHVLTIKPGFVDTPMTADLPKNFLWAKPENVGKAIVNAIEKKKDVVYVPGYWRMIMFVVKGIPESIFKRLSV